MFAATALLTLTTLFGLAVGFAREMLLVASWGATGKTDAFLVAMFLPEAVRMALTSGLLASAALPLWLSQPDEAEQRRWASAQTLHMLFFGIGTALLLSVLAPTFVRMVGPGMAPASHAQAAQALQLLAWTLPGILMQALLSIFHAARQRYFLSGIGSLVFNLPGVLYLTLFRSESTMHGLSLAFVAGSLLMTLILMPFAWRSGWRPASARPAWDSIASLYRSLVPLLASSAASQGLTLVERIVASQLGEGAITVLNLARKLINIPMIGLLSLSQVLLSHMSKQSNEQDRTRLLSIALTWATLLAAPAAVGLVFGAEPLVALLLPHQVAHTQVPQLISLFGIGIAFSSWNGLFARYFYSQADTRTPLKFELTGNAVNLAFALVLPSLYGLAALPVAATLGVMVTTLLLARQTPLADQMGRHAAQIAAGACATGGLWMIIRHLEATSLWLQLGIAVVFGLLTLAGLVWWLKPWQHSSPAAG